MNELIELLKNGYHIKWNEKKQQFTQNRKNHF